MCHVFNRLHYIAGESTRQTRKFLFRQPDKAGTLAFKGTAKTQAQKFLAALQGGQLLARSFKDIEKFDEIAEELITALAVN